MKLKETKLQPGTAGPGNRLGCCLVSFHFMWAILCPQAQNDVGESDNCSRTFDTYFRWQRHTIGRIHTPKFGLMFSSRHVNHPRPYFQGDALGQLTSCVVTIRMRSLKHALAHALQNRDANKISMLNLLLNRGPSSKELLQRWAKQFILDCVNSQFKISGMVINRDTVTKLLDFLIKLGAVTELSKIY